MTTSSDSTTSAKPTILQRIFPYVGGFDLCFMLTYAVVLTGIIGLLGAAVVTSQVLYAVLALWLVVSAVLGQIAPLYPIGILSVFMVGALCVSTYHYGISQSAKAQTAGVEQKAK